MKPFYNAIQIALIVLIEVSLSTISATPLRPNVCKPLVEHLKEVNVQWEWASKEANPELLQQPVTFTNDIMRIQAHLAMVEGLLRAHTPMGLNAAQLQNRNRCLDILHGYMVAGKFPANLYVNHRQPFFIDDFGTACAVGYLMIQTGYENVAQKIHCEFNTGYVAQLAPLYPEILTWADAFGFEARELALIQPAYAPSYGYVWEFLGDGTDGLVRASTQLPNGSVVIGGDFTTANWVTCNNVAVWNGHDFAPLGGGLSGQVYALAYYGNNLWAGGFFNSGNNTYNLARWNGTNWVYLNIGLGTSYALLVHNSRLYVANESGVFVRYNTSWSNVGYFNGPVYALGTLDGNLVAGGSFSQANGVPAGNIAQYGATEMWSAIGTGVHAPVRALAVLDNVLYAGGDFVNSGVSGLMRRSGGVWQQLINTSAYAPNGQGGRINTLAVQGNELYVGGYFQSGMANNLARFRPSDNSFALLTVFFGSPTTPDEIHNLNVYNGNLLIGGRLSELWGSGGDISFANNLMFANVTTVELSLQCWLQGAYNTVNQNMVSSLRANNLLPLQQPYDAAPWYYDGSEAVVSTNAIPTDAIDWVLVELRDTSSLHHLIEARAGWLLSNGQIADVSGSNRIKFDNARRLGQYYIVVRHRNHLAVMSKYAVRVPNEVNYSFAYSDNVAGGVSQLAVLGSSGTYGLCAGDLDANGVITVSDSNVLNAQLSIMNQYATSDCDLNKSVTTSDFNFFKPNMGRIGIETIRY